MGCERKRLKKIRQQWEIKQEWERLSSAWNEREYLLPLMQCQGKDSNVAMQESNDTILTGSHCLLATFLSLSNHFWIQQQILSSYGRQMGASKTLRSYNILENRQKVQQRKMISQPWARKKAATQVQYLLERESTQDTNLKGQSWRKQGFANSVVQATVCLKQKLQVSANREKSPSPVWFS